MELKRPTRACLWSLAALASCVIAPPGCGSERLAAVRLTLTASADALDFGQVILGQTEELLVTLTNGGESPITIDEVDGDTLGGSVTAQLDALVIEVRQSATLRVRFGPVREGAYETSFVLANNSANQPDFTVTVTGTGVDPGPCAGVDCTTPPASLCVTSSTARVYLPGGRCENGTCIFDENDEACTFGCSNGGCDPDPCLGVSCQQPPNPYCYLNTGSCSAGSCTYTPMSDGVDCNDAAAPPASLCVDATTRRRYLIEGQCSNGQCQKLSVDEPCTYGCASGECNPGPCAGVTCADPPNTLCYPAAGVCDAGLCSYLPVVNTTACTAPGALPDPSCVDGNTLRLYQAEGACSGGQCLRNFVDSPCTFGCAGGACLPDPCIGVTCTTPPNTDCFAATGLCTGGACDYQPLAVGTGCASGDLCVPTATCTAAGSCSGPRTTCTAPAQTCSNLADGTGLIVRYDQAVASCDSATGTCTYQRLADIPCQFGCTGDSCAGDPCVGTPCDDGTPCTLDTCVPGGGTYTCAYDLATLPDNVTGISCTIGGGQCNQGQCQVNGSGTGTYARCEYVDGAACVDDWDPSNTPAFCTLADVPGSCIAGGCVKDQAPMDAIINGQCVGCFLCQECPSNGVNGSPWICL